MLSSMSEDDYSELFTEITGKEKIEKEQNEDDDRLRGEETDKRSKTDIDCPKCENDRAYYEMKQIRAADESETRFFECTECGHQWREDDH